MLQYEANHPELWSWLLPLRYDHSLLSNLVIDKQRDGSIQLPCSRQSHYGFLCGEAHLLQLLQPGGEGVWSNPSIQVFILITYNWGLRYARTVMRILRTLVLLLCRLYPQVHREEMLIFLLSASAPLITVNLLLTETPGATLTQTAAMLDNSQTGMHWQMALVYYTTIVIKLVNSNYWMWFEKKN